MQLASSKMLVAAKQQNLALRPQGPRVVSHGDSLRARPHCLQSSTPRVLFGFGVTAATLCQLSSKRRCRYQSLAMRQLKGDTAEDFEPIGEYKALKSDAIASWGFLEEDEFLQRVQITCAIGTLLGFAFANVIFPLTSPSTGEFSLANAAIDLLGGLAAGLFLLFVVFFYMLRQWDVVNKLLRQRSYIVEGRVDGYTGDGGAYAYEEGKSKKEIRRDRLLSSYVTEPVLERLRTYVLGSLAASLVAFAGSNVIGGEIQELLEEEEDDVPTLYDPQKERNKMMNRAGLAYFTK